MDTTAHPRPRGRVIVAVIGSALCALVALAAVVAADSGGDDSRTLSDRADSPSIVGAPERADDGGGSTAYDPGMQAADSLDSLGRDDAADLTAPDTAPEAATGKDLAPAVGSVQRKAVISNGDLRVEAEDIVEARHDALAAVTALGGSVDNETSGSDDDGELQHVDLTLRVPATSFTKGMDRLADLGTLRDRSQSSKDVTTEVIDIAARERAQRASVESIERLLARATTIGEIMSVEAQLTRRQAALDSLEQQQKFLADQTSMSTIHLLLTRPDEPEEKDEDNSGFLGGLEDGWNALGDTVVAIGTVTGAVLPFAGVLALLGFPAWIGIRRLRAARPAPMVEPGS